MNNSAREYLRPKKTRPDFLRKWALERNDLGKFSKSEVTQGKKKRIGFDEKRNETISFSPHSSVHTSTPSKHKGTFVFPSEKRNWIVLESESKGEVQGILEKRERAKAKGESEENSKKEKTKRSPVIFENSEELFESDGNSKDEFQWGSNGRRDSFLELEIKMQKLEKESLEMKTPLENNTIYRAVLTDPTSDTVEEPNDFGDKGLAVWSMSPPSLELMGKKGSERDSGLKEKRTQDSPEMGQELKEHKGRNELVLNHSSPKEKDSRRRGQEQKEESKKGPLNFKASSFLSNLSIQRKNKRAILDFDQKASPFSVESEEPEIDVPCFLTSKKRERRVSRNQMRSHDENLRKSAPFESPTENNPKIK